MYLLKNKPLEKTAAFISSGFFLTHPFYKHLIPQKTPIKRCLGLTASILAALIWLFVPSFKTAFLAVFVVCLTLFAVFATSLAEEYYQKKDDRRIILDELVGYLWTALLVRKEPLTLIAAFVIFHIIDAAKPLGIRRLESLPRGWGCVSDDVASGILAGLLTGLILGRPSF